MAVNAENSVAETALPFGFQVHVGRTRSFGLKAVHIYVSQVRLYSTSFSTLAVQVCHLCANRYTFYSK